MTKSKLATLSIPSPNRYSPRTARVSKVTVHHMAGALTAEQCGKVFSSSAREASSNYGIGGDGRIACYVDEDDAAWTSSSYWNDNRAITIEVANTPDGVANATWEVSNAAWKSLVALCADICKRYGITPSYDGTTNASFTEHRMFAATGCPGPYIHARMSKLVNEVKSAMEGDIDMATGKEIMDWLTYDGDASGRGKKSNFRDRLAWMAAKQELMQKSVDQIQKDITEIKKSLKK